MMWHALEDVLYELDRMISQRPAWCEFATNYISWIAGKLGIRQLTVFSGYSNILNRQDEVRSLMFRLLEAGAVRDDVAWCICSYCGIRFTYVGVLAANQACPKCEAIWSFDQGILAPKVTLDDILDEYVDPEAVMFSNIGGLNHILDSKSIQSSLSLRSNCLHVISDSGMRDDYLSVLMGQAFTTRRRPRDDQAEVMTRLIRRATEGYYSSIYYMIGDRLRETT